VTAELDVARIAIAEASPAYARRLAAFLERDPDLRVVGRFTDTGQAVELVRRNGAELLVLDLDAGAEGVALVERVMAEHPLPVMVLTGTASLGSPVVVAALAAGAIDAHAKADLLFDEPDGARAVLFRRRVKRLSRARVTPRRARGPALGVMPGTHPASAIAIAASTGGPAALAAIVRALPADFAVPVFVVQHITQGFMGDLVRLLDRTAPLPVRIAPDGSRTGPGIWFAPDDAHLVVDGQLRTHFDREAVAGHHRPAADVLFSSLAGAVGERGVTVVLTGMGSDGAEGTAAMRGAGGLTIAQDEETSAIFGMPRAAAQAGAQVVLPLDRIGPTLAAIRAPAS